MLNATAPTQPPTLATAGTNEAGETAETMLWISEHEWLYELKWDGYRALLIKDGEDVQIRSRNDNDLTAMYPGIAAAGRRQKIKQIVLDGEIVALGEDGRPSFQALQHRMAEMFVEVQETRSILYRGIAHLEGSPAARRQAVSAAKVMLGSAGRFVGAQGIPVRQEYVLTIQLDHDRITQQLAAGAQREARAQQKVAVAVQGETGDA